MSKSKLEYNPPKIVRVQIHEFVVFEIQEHELNTLEASSLSDLYLNIAISALTIGLSFLTSLLTVEVDGIILTIFIVMAALGFTVSVIMGLIWYRVGDSRKSTISNIRARGASNKLDE